MITTRTVFEYEVEGRKYRFECAPDSPIDHVTLVSNYIISYCVQRKQEADEQAKKDAEANQVEEKPVELEVVEAKAE